MKQGRRKQKLFGRAFMFTLNRNFLFEHCVVLKAEIKAKQNIIKWYGFIDLNVFSVCQFLWFTLPQVYV